MALVTLAGRDALLGNFVSFIIRLAVPCGKFTITPLFLYLVSSSSQGRRDVRSNES